MPYYKMADGRAFTDYNPSCSVVKHLQDKFNVHNGHDFRYFLQRNTDQVIQELKRCTNHTNVCTLCPICKKALEYKP